MKLSALASIIFSFLLVSTLSGFEQGALANFDDDDSRLYEELDDYLRTHPVIYKDASWLDSLLSRVADIPGVIDVYLKVMYWWNGVKEDNSFTLDATDSMLKDQDSGLTFRNNDEFDPDFANGREL